MDKEQLQEIKELKEKIYKLSQLIIKSQLYKKYSYRDYFLKVRKIAINELRLYSKIEAKYIYKTIIRAMLDEINKPENIDKIITADMAKGDKDVYYCKE